ncbi:MAG: FAD-binding oxidoreductase [Clostridiales bacterium]
MKRLFYIILYFISPLLPIFVTILANTEKYKNTNNLISLIFGACAFTWLSFELILSSRSKFIEANFGLDKLIRFHALMAVISLVLVFIHKSYKWENEFGDISFNLFILISIISLIFMVNIISNKIQPLKKLKIFLSKYHITKYQYQVAIHNLTVVAVIIMFIHVMFATSTKQSIELQIVYILYFGGSISFYFYNKVIKRFILSKNKLKVVNLTKVSDDITVINLKSETNNIFNFKPGQFGYLKINDKNFSKEGHPFSIISIPGQSNELNFAIKKLGDYTSKIDTIQINSSATVDGPYGRLSYLNYTNERNIVLIAGGIGITPMIGMLRYMNLYDKSRNVILIWGVNTKSDIIFHQEFLDIQKNMTNFNFVPVVFRDNSYDGEKGRIDNKKLNKIFTNSSIDLSEAGFYICGPSIMIKLVLTSLKSLNVSKKQLHLENFNF